MSFSRLLAQFLSLLVSMKEVLVPFAGSIHTYMHLWARLAFSPLTLLYIHYNVAVDFDEVVVILNFTHAEWNSTL